jgi:hypothetical protein
MMSPLYRSKKILASGIFNYRIAEGTRMVEKQLDIVSLLKKLQEIDKLKSIILTNQAKLMFNGMIRPIISLSQLDRRLFRTP